MMSFSISDNLDLITMAISVSKRECDFFALVARALRCLHQRVSPTPAGRPYGNCLSYIVTVKKEL